MPAGGEQPEGATSGGASCHGYVCDVEGVLRAQVERCVTTSAETLPLGSSGSALDGAQDFSGDGEGCCEGATVWVTALLGGFDGEEVLLNALSCSAMEVVGGSVSNALCQGFELVRTLAAGEQPLH